MLRHRALNTCTRVKFALIFVRRGTTNLYKTWSLSTIPRRSRITIFRHVVPNNSNNHSSLRASSNEQYTCANTLGIQSKCKLPGLSRSFQRTDKLLGTIFNRLDTSIPVPRIHNNQRPSKLHLVPPPPSTVSSRTPTDQHRQSFLESSFPSTYLVPSTSAISAAASSNEKELDREQNTIIKFTLDQTIGAAVNTLLFSLVFAGFRGADMAQATQIAKQDFWGLMSAGWKLWPLVSAINFTLVKSVQTRNLVGSLAGMGWNVYLSLVAGES
jgi:hypothetical protein